MSLPVTSLVTPAPYYYATDHTGKSLDFISPDREHVEKVAVTHGGECKEWTGPRPDDPPLVAVMYYEEDGKGQWPMICGKAWAELQHYDILTEDPAEVAKFQALSM